MLSDFAASECDTIFPLPMSCCNRTSSLRATMTARLAWALVLALGPTVASAQCYEDNRCFYTCGYGYYQHAGLVL